MREDDFTRDEQGAADYAALIGRNEDFGDGPGNQDPNPLLDAPDARLRPDPWDVWVCAGCGDVTDSQPQKCGCGLVNYGGAA